MNFFDLKKLLTKILQNIRRLPNYYSTDGEYNSRPLSANINSDDSGSVINFLATGNMTEGKPTSDGNILHFNWDNNNKWASQLAIPHGEGGVIQWRAQKNGTTWNNWHDVWYDPVEIPANTDLNAYKSPGTRYCPSSGTAATLKNCPTTNAFFLYIEKANRPDTTISDTYQYYIQTIKDLYGKVYIRYLHNNKGTWSIGAWGNGVPYLGNAATQSVANSLSTSSAGYVLDARKGKELNDKFASYATTSSLNNYLPKSGGTATGNIAINHSNTTESSLRVSNSQANGTLYAGNSGNFGLWNSKLGHALITENKNGTVSIHGWDNSASTQSFSSQSKNSTDGKSYSHLAMMWNAKRWGKFGIITIASLTNLTNTGDYTLFTVNPQFRPAITYTTDIIVAGSNVAQCIRVSINSTGEVKIHNYNARIKTDIVNIRGTLSYICAGA